MKNPWRKKQTSGAGIELSEYGLRFVEELMRVPREHQKEWTQAVGDNSQKYEKIVHEMIDRKELKQVQEIARALLDAPYLSQDGGVRKGCLDRIETKLAYTPGNEYAELLLEIASWQMPVWGPRETRPQQRRLARIARDLACGQPPETLQFCMKHGFKEGRVLLLFLLAHEIVIRKISVAIPETLLPRVGEYSPSLNMLRYNCYPGFELHKIEEEIDPGTFKMNGGGWSGPTEPIAEEEKIPVRDTEGVTVEKKHDHTVYHIEACIEEWHSNHQKESAIFTFSEAIQAEAFSPALLAMTHLDCLDADISDISTKKITPTTAFKILFSVACFGGAYGSGMYGAYGRLAAWKSLCGLTGLDPDKATADELEKEANRCSWFCFHNKGGWFYDIAWDFGIVCLRSDGKSMALIAGTDTD